jgi:hypothetical protein
VRGRESEGVEIEREEEREVKRERLGGYLGGDRERGRVGDRER